MPRTGAAEWVGAWKSSGTGRRSRSGRGVEDGGADQDGAWELSGGTRRRRAGGWSGTAESRRVERDGGAGRRSRTVERDGGAREWFWIETQGEEDDMVRGGVGRWQSD